MALVQVKNQILHSGSWLPTALPAYPLPRPQLPLFDYGWVAGWHVEEGWMPGGSSDGEGGSPPGSQLDAEEQLEAEEGGEERPPAVWRYALLPPTQVCRGGVRLGMTSATVAAYCSFVCSKNLYLA